MSLFFRLATLLGSLRGARATFDRYRSSADEVRQTVGSARSRVVRETVHRAEQGEMAAQFSMGERCYQGVGVPKDWEVAALWFSKAAAQGHPKAQLNLGLMYVVGHGVPRDPVEAWKWVELAARKEPSARPAMEKLRKKLSPEQILEGRRRAAAFS